MDEKIICIVNADSQKESSQQAQNWLELSSAYMIGIATFLNINTQSHEEIVGSIQEEMVRQGTLCVALETFSILSRSMSEAILISSAIVDSGGRLFTVSYAVNQPPLVEVAKETIQFMETIDEFMVIDEEDLSFLQYYLHQEVTLDTLTYYLSALQASITELGEDGLSYKIVIGDIRRAILLTRMIQQKVTN